MSDNPVPGVARTWPSRAELAAMSAAEVNAFFESVGSDWRVRSDYIPAKPTSVAHVHLWHHRHTPTTACTKPVHVCPSVEPAGLDVERLADIAEMAAGEVMTGNDYARYHKAIRQHFVARLTRAAEYAPFDGPPMTRDTDIAQTAAVLRGADRAMRDERGRSRNRTALYWRDLAAALSPEKQ